MLSPRPWPCVLHAHEEPGCLRCAALAAWPELAPPPVGRFATVRLTAHRFVVMLACGLLLAALTSGSSTLGLVGAGLALVDLVLAP